MESGYTAPIQQNSSACATVGATVVPVSGEQLSSTVSSLQSRGGHICVLEADSMKRCSKCHKEKPLTDFSKRKSTKDGFRGECRACASVAFRDFYVRNIEAQHERSRAYAATHKENIAAYNKKWHEDNREYHLGLNRQWLANNKEHKRQYNQDFRRNRPGYNTEQCRRRRARKLGGVCTLSRSEWEAIKTAYNHRCVYCGKIFKKLTQDHVIPLSKGGAHSAGNVVPACHRCNAKKQAGPVINSFQRTMFVLLLTEQDANTDAQRRTWTGLRALHKPGVEERED